MRKFYSVISLMCVLCIALGLKAQEVKRDTVYVQKTDTIYIAQTVVREQAQVEEVKADSAK